MEKGVTFGKAVFFSQANPPKGLIAEDCLLRALPASGVEAERKSFTPEKGSGQKGTASTIVRVNFKWDSSVSRLG